MTRKPAAIDRRRPCFTRCGPSTGPLSVTFHHDWGRHNGGPGRRTLREDPSGDFAVYRAQAVRPAESPRFAPRVRVRVAPGPPGWAASRPAGPGSSRSAGPGSQGRFESESASEPRPDSEPALQTQCRVASTSESPLVRVVKSRFRVSLRRTGLSGPPHVPPARRSGWPSESRSG